MKHLIIALILLVMTTLTWAEPAPLVCTSPIGAQTLAASSTTTHYMITLDRNEGYFSVQPVFTGTGVLKLQYQISNDGANWSTAVDIIASATTAVVYPFPAAGVSIFGKHLRIVAVETGGAATVVLTGLVLCIQ